MHHNGTIFDAIMVSNGHPLGWTWHDLGMFWHVLTCFELDDEHQNTQDVFEHP